MKKTIAVILCSFLISGLFTGCNVIGGLWNSVSGSGESSETEELSFSMHDTWERFSDYFLYINKDLNQGESESSSSSGFSASGFALDQGMVQMKDDPHTYWSFFQIIDSSIYLMLDENNEVVAGLILTPEDTDDPYNGKREAISLSYALAPDNAEDETDDDRRNEIDTLGYGNRCTFGSDETVTISKMNSDGYTLYFESRSNASQESKDNMQDWVADMVQHAIEMEMEE